MPREGGSSLAGAQEAPPTTRAPLPAEAARMAAGTQAVSGGWRVAPPGAGACPDPKLPLPAQGKPSPMASSPGPALHPHHHPPFSHLHQFPHPAGWPCSTLAVPCLSTFSLLDLQAAPPGLCAGRVPRPERPSLRFTLCLTGSFKIIAGTNLCACVGQRKGRLGAQTRSQITGCAVCYLCDRGPVASPL